ncbi:MAG: hypothetical protein GWN67_09375 [Phycisphaerae bacterium]|nr:hypothetical protein [Phycisphaerae bacterium]NIP52313.1 hypothetical protein [Phycisphaerae bacterium]NIS51276.1 hypothetical protein [Phycisphaerae bacterium]NIU09788.1 hypothetical protein [Phycisphaerae bacterium]NIU56576.1 hypothetical protein [Phycisphaerae bacterium]
MIRNVKLVNVVVLLMSCCFAWSAWAKAAELPVRKKPGYEWRKTDSSLALLNRGKVVWRLNFDKKEGKPYFHPVSLVDGMELTWLRPADHPWHRALWFSWKFINGVNYWEEDPKTGLSPGRTEVGDVKVLPHIDNSGNIEMLLNYHRPGEENVLTEKRLIAVSAPDENGRYHIDLHSTFTAGEKDVLLSRTPIPGEEGGKAWGGYAGLSIRMAKATRGWQFVDSEGRKDKQIHGKKARWVDFSGELPNGKEAGITIFDHTENLRNPSPWYVEKGMPYFSPAVLFNKPYKIAARESLQLWYRILIHPGSVDKEVLEGEWKAFGNLKCAAIAEVLEGVDQGKAAVRVDLLVCEVNECIEIDWEAAEEIKNLVGEEKALTTAAVLKSAVQRKRVARGKLANLVDLLGSKGYLKILMNPTLEVLDGKTAKVRSSYKEPTGKEIVDSFEITPRIFDDDYMNVSAKMVFQNRQISDLRKRVRDGQSFISGSVRNEPATPDEPATETIFIITAAISKDD